jgi:thiosulfate dehydrogenase (quinone)
MTTRDLGAGLWPMTDGASQRVATTIAATGAEDWRAAALVLLPVRFIQGFIYWGGGSRRFIYAPGKLAPHAPIWMANKFESAVPGALLGIDHVIAFFWLLYPSVVLFSAAELFGGLFLMLGPLRALRPRRQRCFRSYRC